jgi:hypothetical protein
LLEVIALITHAENSGGEVSDQGLGRGQSPQEMLRFLVLFSLRMLRFLVFSYFIIILLILTPCRQFYSSRGETWVNIIRG